MIAFCTGFIYNYSDMEADLFGDGRSIFTDGLGDGRLGRAIGDTGKDDPAFFQGQV